MKNVSTVRSRRRSNCQMSRTPLCHSILYRKSIFSCRYRTRMTRLFHFLIKVCLFLLLVMPYPDCGSSFPCGPKIVSGTEITVTPHLISHSSFAIKRKSYGDMYHNTLSNATILPMMRCSRFVISVDIPNVVSPKYKMSITKVTAHEL